MLIFLFCVYIYIYIYIYIPQLSTTVGREWEGTGSQITFLAVVGGSCLKTGQHFIFAIIYQLLPIKCIIFDFVSNILFIFLLPIIIIILIMKILLHNVYKIINLRYPTYVYPFLIFFIITKIECWPVFKQDPGRATFGARH